MGMSKAVAPELQSQEIGLGIFADGARVWDRMISNAAAYDRVKVFQNCCREGASFISHGADRATLADALTELAHRHNLEKPLGGSDGIQHTISDAFIKTNKTIANDATEITHGQDGKKAKSAPHLPSSRFAERFLLTRLSDIDLDDQPMFLLEGVIPAGPALGVIFGPPKAGKTFLAADLFLHIALGRNYCGCAVQQGAVAYITSEGVRGFKRRMVATRQHREVGPETPFFVAHVMPNLGALPGDIEALVDAIQKQIPEGTPLAAVIIDTLARALTGQSDSDAAAMGVFVDNCDTLAKRFGCFVGVVHHSPRADQTHSRGSNVLDGAADVLIFGDERRCDRRLDCQG